MRKIFLPLTGVLLFLASCTKPDHADPQPPPPPDPQPPTVNLQQQMVTASVIGEVIDENNQPLSGVAVNGGGKTASTDNNGRFRLAAGNFNGLNAIVKLEKTGYFTLVKTTMLSQGSTDFLRIKMLPLVNYATIPSGIGGQVALPGMKLIINFPANAFVTDNGAAYTGNVSVMACYLDPGSNDLPLQMPGNLTGTEDGTTIKALQTYGMTGVELRGTNNEKLKLATSKKATISVLIPASASFVPDEMPLWHFDESAGIWVKEGVAKKESGRYVAEVSHFSFWNYDWPLDQVILKLRIFNKADSTPMPGLLVKLNDLQTGSEESDFTDTSGRVAGYVFRNRQLRLRVITTCNFATIADTLIGSFNQNTDLGNLYFNTAPNYVIRGTMLNCSGLPVTNGHVTFPFNGLNYTTKTTASGNFAIGIYACSMASITGTLTAIDSSTNQTITPVLVTVNNNQKKDVGFLFPCANPPQEFISYTLDGAPHFFVRNLDSAFCTRTYAFNRTNIACRRANGTPMQEGYVAFITGPTKTASTDTSSILTLHQYTTASTPSSLNILQFTETYSQYPPVQGVEGWVTGQFSCTFMDAANGQHTIKSYFKMWRRN